MTDWNETSLAEYVSDLTVDQIAQLHDGVEELVRFAEDAGFDTDTADDEMPKYKHGETYSLSADGESSSQSEDDETEYESGETYDLPSK
ncbi:hypothetical protein [Salinirarus marinus]|uniref:hypothetical protein n=1 Tax=Salinirarus marinus TaxID=3068310 RepID=UPI003C6BE487